MNATYDLGFPFTVKNIIGTIGKIRHKAVN